MCYLRFPVSSNILKSGCEKRVGNGTVSIHVGYGLHINLAPRSSCTLMNLICRVISSIIYVIMDRSWEEFPFQGLAYLVVDIIGLNFGPD